MAVSDLDEIEAIKQLKYRYLRAVDLKLWELLESTFAPDAVSAYDGGKQSYQGRAAIVAWLRSAMDNDLITLHQVHHPEIVLDAPDAARGTWYLEDRVINPGGDLPEMPGRSILSGAGFYSDEYVKIGAEWKIALTGYERTFIEIRDYETPTMLSSRWEGRARASG
jgi:hypothetical protein